MQVVENGGQFAHHQKVATRLTLMVFDVDCTTKFACYERCGCYHEIGAFIIVCRLVKSFVIISKWAGSLATYICTHSMD